MATIELTRTSNIEKTEVWHTLTSNGRNIRRVVATSARQLGKNKRPDFVNYMNHGDNVDRTAYQCPIAEECMTGQDAIKHVGQMEKVKEVVRKDISKICAYSADAVFPSQLR